jgi:fructose-bisphosphate aldolase class I
MNTHLHTIAQQMVAQAKGLLAADESTSTIGKRFDTIQVENTEDNRRAYRELLFTTPGFEQYISGVILFDETLRQSASTGESFVSMLVAKGVLPGIKVDLGVEPFAESEGDVVTLGLDGLPDRLAEYAQLGATFTKWRAVFNITDTTPTTIGIRENARRLALYAKMVQEAGMVPIVEPEVVMDGTHTLERCKEVTLEAQYALFEELIRAEVDLQAVILKPNFVLAGTNSGEVFDAAISAVETLDVLSETVPVEVPGIMFLSGGLSEQDAADVLREINILETDNDWALSFSYGRALQRSALEAWRGKEENLVTAQQAFLTMAKLHSDAVRGQ